MPCHVEISLFPAKLRTWVYIVKFRSKTDPTQRFKYLSPQHTGAVRAFFASVNAAESDNFLFHWRVQQYCCSTLQLKNRNMLQQEVREIGNASSCENLLSAK